MTRLRHCERCDNRGLIRVLYHSGEPFDVAICDCDAGRLWDALGVAKIRERFHLTAEQQVAYVEDFEGEDVVPPSTVPAEAFIEAGQTARRAKL